MANLKENKKRGLFLLLLVTTIFGLNFVQAYLGTGYTVGDVFLLVLFIVFFFILNIAFSKFFKDSEGRPMKSAWVPALALALGATYGIWKTGFDVGDFFFRIGIQEQALNVITPILLVISLIFIIWRFGFSKLFFFAGGGLVLGGIIYFHQTFWSVFIGIVLIALGWWIRRRARRKDVRERIEVEKAKQKFGERSEKKRRKRESKEERKKRKREEREKKKARKNWKKKYRSGRKRFEKGYMRDIRGHQRKKKKRMKNEGKWPGK